MSDPFEAFIEAQLNRHLGPLVGSAVPPSAGRFAAAAVGAGLSASAGSGLLAALSTKTAAVLAALGLAAGGGGAVAATVATGSSNPVVWEQQVQVVVSQCRAEFSPGERGFGHCVSNVVSAQQELLPSPSATAAEGSDMVVGGTITPPTPVPTPAAKAAAPTPKPLLPPAVGPPGGEEGGGRDSDGFTYRPEDRSIPPR